VDRDLEAVAETLAGHAELRRALSSPGVPDGARRGLVAALASRLSLVPPVAKLLALLADRRRLDVLPEIAAAYRRRLLAHQRVVEADVTSAAPLTVDATAALQGALSRATGSQVRLRAAVDPSLLGGVVARVGSTVYDGSVRTQLKKLRERLVAG
jgi:F-type H+-transporting ATPase subunit delta